MSRSFWIQMTFDDNLRVIPAMLSKMSHCGNECCYVYMDTMPNNELN